MLFISTAIAFSFLPTFLSALESAATPSVNDFENNFSADFSAPMEGAALIDDENEINNDNGNFKMALDLQQSYEDGNDFISIDSGLSNVENDMGFSNRRRIKPKSIDYTILIKTGNKWFSGTDSRIFITFADANSNTVSSFLSKSNWFDRRFNRNHLGKFSISTVSNLEDICMVTIGNDMKGWFPSWYHFHLFMI